jgi:arginine deiminase
LGSTFLIFLDKATRPGMNTGAEPAPMERNPKIIGKIPEGTFLEGGDFFVAKDDLCMLGIGLRTKVEAAYYLMYNNILGSRRFALVIDEFDLDQQRIYLDTYFNF